MVQAKLKWQKQKLEIQIDPSSSVGDLKAAIFSLTGVPVERQKLTCPKAWKGQLTDAVDLSTCTLKEGMTVMLIGSADVVAAQTTAVKFVEDMKEEEVAAVSLPVGFRNLGNTCYMNSTLQCLRFVPELQEALRAFRPDQASSQAQQSSAMVPARAGDAAFTRAIGSMYAGMERTTQPYPPMEFWAQLKQLYPQFAQTSRTGMPMQQDAEELFSSTTTALASTLREPHGLKDLGGATNLIDALFGMEMEQVTTCDESPDEPPKNQTEISRKLVCNISGGVGGTTSVDHLHQGVMLGLKGSVELNSEVLGRNALWTRVQRIKRLPRYICVQFMRFYWKEARVLEEGREVLRGQKCKIMRPVSFPEVLDVYDFCSEGTQQILKRNRDRHGDEILGSLKTGQGAEDTSGSSSMDVDTGVRAPEPTVDPSDAMDQDDVDDELQKALKMSMEQQSSGAEDVETVGPGIPPDFQGNYELFGVVTHKGRLADGGHYMGWVRQDGDDWLLFDDDEVTPCKTDHVMPLKGGGDSDMAYLAFYRVKN